jgi:S1-C subfamily serine protease
MSEDVQRIAQDADKYIELMTKSVADAQKANSWQGEPSNLFGQARALEPGIAFPDSALGTLRASKAFVEALPPDRRAELGLPGDPRDFNLGARYYQSTPALLAVVPKGSLADKLGFRAGDRLVTIDGAPAASVWSLKLAMRARAGRKLPVVIEREGKQERRELAVPATLP